MKTKLVIFGITGDLSTRKLLPALEHILNSGEFDDLSIVGVSRSDLDVAELLQHALGDNQVSDRFSGFTLDLARAGDYQGLKDYLALTPQDQALIYLSVPPSAAAQIVNFLGQAGLNTPNVKLLFEKPFGFNLDTAQDFIERTAQHFNDAQIYRIDHYMAKEVAAEIIRLRSNAENHHHSWGKQSITSIDIVASESIGIEGRSVFYEQTGALRDFIQGHLIQLLSLVLMDVPTDFDNRQLSTYRLRALEQLNLADPDGSIRAQYEGYQDDAHNPGSLTETFVNMRLSSSDPKWQDVGLRLVTGKNLQDKRTSITVTYTDGTQDVFEEATVAPDDARLPDAYERVLKEAILGNKAIFTSSAEIIRSWEIVFPVQQAWEFDEDPLSSYPAGAAWQNVTDSTVSVE